MLIVALWPLGLTGIWLNFAGTSALAGVLSLGILVWMRREWNARTPRRARARPGRKRTPGPAGTQGGGPPHPACKAPKQSA